MSATNYKNSLTEEQAKQIQGNEARLREALIRQRGLDGIEEISPILIESRQILGLEKRWKAWLSEFAKSIALTARSLETRYVISRWIYSHPEEREILRGKDVPIIELAKVILLIQNEQNQTIRVLFFEEMAQQNKISSKDMILIFTRHFPNIEYHHKQKEASRILSLVQRIKELESQNSILRQELELERSSSIMNLKKETFCGNIREGLFV